MLDATNTKRSPYYESLEFNVVTATTDYDVDAEQAGFLSKIGPGTSHDSHPGRVIIRTDQTISVKFNKTTNDAITVASTDSPLVFDGEISNIFISNASGSTAAVKIIVLP